MSQLNREALLAKVEQYFIDNVTEKITPAQALEVFRDLIYSSWNIQDDKIPFPEEQDGNIPPWVNNLAYKAGDQVTNGSKFWQSKQDNNLNQVPAESAWWFELSPSHLPNTDRQLIRNNGAILTADAIFLAMSQLLNKMDKGVLFLPVNDLAGLKALDTTSSQDWPDRGFIYVKGLKKLFALHRDSVEPADDDQVVAPTTGAGRWVLIAGGSAAPADPPVGGELSGTASNATLSNAAVISKVATGLGEVNGAMAATDSIILLFSKIRFFISNIAGTVRNTLLTGLDVNLPGAPAATDRLIDVLGKLTRMVNALPPGATASAHSGNAIDFTTKYQTRTLNNVQLTITSFTNTGLDRSVKLTITSLNPADTFSVNVPGWTGRDVGFLFVAGAVNVVNILLVSNTEYEVFINPLVP